MGYAWAKCSKRFLMVPGERSIARKSKVETGFCGKLARDSPQPEKAKSEYNVITISGQCLMLVQRTRANVIKTLHFTVLSQLKCL